MNLEPGVELDELVARTIGWTARTDFEKSPNGVLWLDPKTGCEFLTVPPYSVSANAALEAAESMFRDFYIWHNDSGSCYLAYASFTRCIMDDCKFKAMGDTMPHAMCLAILAAKEKP